MVDFEEVVGPEREIVGEKMSICELCRRPMTAASLMTVSGGARLGEPDEILNLCPDCRQRIETGDITFEDAVAAGLEVPEE